MSHYRSKKLLKSADGQTCVLCGRCDGTVVAAHANSVALGKGRGIKCPDYYTAWVCRQCHDQIDGRIPMQFTWAKTPHELWEVAFIRTVGQWFQQGIITVTR